LEGQEVPKVPNMPKVPKVKSYGGHQQNEIVIFFKPMNR
jgi:hypothetical protein